MLRENVTSPGSQSVEFRYGVQVVGSYVSVSMTKNRDNLGNYIRSYLIGKIIRLTKSGNHSYNVELARTIHVKEGDAVLIVLAHDDDRELKGPLF